MILVGVMWILHTLSASGIALKSLRSGTVLPAGNSFLLVAIMVTVILIPFIVYRIRSIYSVFKDGRFCTAEITGINFCRDRGRIDFKFTLGEREHLTGSPIMKNARTTALSVGDEVDIVVHPEKPSRAFIIFLYT
jgi:hypothetical protein